MTIQFVSALLGLLACGTIIFMVRRDKLVSRDAVGWIVIALLIMLLGGFPGITDWVGEVLQVGYPPVLLLLVAILLLLLKMVKADIDKAHFKADIERLLQHQALLYAEIRKLQDKDSGK